MSRHDLAQNGGPNGPVQSAKSDQQIGYGKPPEGVRWKPGQSGNPNGRPKGESLAEIFRRVAEGPAESRKIGQPIDTEMGHIIRRLFSRVGSYSNPAEAKLLLALAREFLPEPEPDAHRSTFASDPNDAIPGPARRD